MEVSEPMEIDDSLYSRQRYVLGDNAMQLMATSNVLIYGMGGLGIEIAKNIVLAGIKCLTVQDPKATIQQDLGTQFFLTDEDVKNAKNRAEASSPLLSELNPYVSLMTMTQELTMTSNLDYLTTYQCVILTDCPLSLQNRVNQFCRSCDPQIKFISSNINGVFGSIFTDFGDSFEVVDSTGEEPRDVFISDITKGNPGIVTGLDLHHNLHNLETDDVITFREVKGMTCLNGKQFPVRVLTPNTFSICDTTDATFGEYENGGIITQVKVSKQMSFSSLEKQIQEPLLQTPDLTKFNVPQILHLTSLTINKFQEEHGCLPKPWDDNDATKFVTTAKSLNDSLPCKVDITDDDIRLITLLCKCASGCFVPLCAVFGGIVAQEALKSLTGKFTPLNQFFYLDASEVIPQKDGINPDQFQARGDRYDPLRICIGQDQLQMLADTKLFMVGCGAIGCEMLKNYALLGVSSGSGKITITDNDLIEKSNLNRQFLFRSHHIQKPKSTTAAQATLKINKDLKIEAQQHKVCPQTQDNVYTDAFFEKQNIIVNALDNVQARRYMDGRCVTNQKALMESGTMGTKAHVQVIVPHMTESYSSQQDPPDEDYPYCTLKSFPSTLEHCIHWARDKFEECFVNGAQLFNKFMETHTDLDHIAQELMKGVSIDGAVKVSKMLDQRPSSFKDCVALARVKFEKYFNHKAMHLLHTFPTDCKLEDGSSFWSPPKRAPVPLEFDIKDDTHVLFVTTTARMLADVLKVKWTPEDLERSAMESAISLVAVPPFKPSNKKVVVDETVKKDEATDLNLTDDVIEFSGRRIQKVLSSKDKSVSRPVMPLDFEKDDDSNGHIDFIATSTNLRAQMYNIDVGERLKIKKIAGRIVPAIATTTASVSGLVTIEMIKVLSKLPMEQLKNCFLNLALPMMLLSEPGPVAKTVLSKGLSVTIWDKWVVRGTKTTTLQQFIDKCKEQYGFEPRSIVQGVKIIYMPFLPGHPKRLSQQMTKLLKPTANQDYVDLVADFDFDGGPPVRYYF